MTCEDLSTKYGEDLSTKCGEDLSIEYGEDLSTNYCEDLSTKYCILSPRSDGGTLHKNQFLIRLSTVSGHCRGHAESAPGTVKLRSSRLAYSARSRGGTTGDRPAAVAA